MELKSPEHWYAFIEFFNIQQTHEQKLEYIRPRTREQVLTELFNILKSHYDEYCKINLLIFLEEQTEFFFEVGKTHLFLNACALLNELLHLPSESEVEVQSKARYNQRGPPACISSGAKSQVIVTLATILLVMSEQEKEIKKEEPFSPEKILVNLIDLLMELLTNAEDKGLRQTAAETLREIETNKMGMLTDKLNKIYWLAQNESGYEGQSIVALYSTVLISAIQLVRNKIKQTERRENKQEYVSEAMRVNSQRIPLSSHTDEGSSETNESYSFHDTNASLDQPSSLKLFSSLAIDLSWFRPVFRPNSFCYFFYAEPLHFHVDLSALPAPSISSMFLDDIKVAVTMLLEGVLSFSVLEAIRLSVYASYLLHQIRDSPTGRPAFCSSLIYSVCCRSLNMSNQAYWIIAASLMSALPIQVWAKCQNAEDWTKPVLRLRDNVLDLFQHMYRYINPIWRWWLSYWIIERPIDLSIATTDKALNLPLKAEALPIEGGPTLASVLYPYRKKLWITETDSIQLKHIKLNCLVYFYDSSLTVSTKSGPIAPKPPISFVERALMHHIYDSCSLPNCELKMNLKDRSEPKQAPILIKGCFCFVRIFLQRFGLELFESLWLGAIHPMLYFHPYNASEKFIDLINEVEKNASTYRWLLERTCKFLTDMRPPRLFRYMGLLENLAKIQCVPIHELLDTILLHLKQSNWTHSEKEARRMLQNQLIQFVCQVLVSPLFHLNQILSSVARLLKYLAVTSHDVVIRDISLFYYKLVTHASEEKLSLILNKRGGSYEEMIRKTDQKKRAKLRQTKDCSMNWPEIYNLKQGDAVSSRQNYPVPSFLKVVTQERVEFLESNEIGDEHEAVEGGDFDESSIEENFKAYKQYLIRMHEREFLKLQEQVQKSMNHEEPHAFRAECVNEHDSNEKNESTTKICMPLVVLFKTLPEISGNVDQIPRVVYSLLLRIRGTTPLYAHVQQEFRIPCLRADYKSTPETKHEPEVSFRSRSLDSAIADENQTIGKIQDENNFEIKARAVEPNQKIKTGQKIETNSLTKYEEGGLSSKDDSKLDPLVFPSSYQFYFSFHVIFPVPTAFQVEASYNTEDGQVAHSVPLDIPLNCFLQDFFLPVPIRQKPRNISKTKYLQMLFAKFWEEADQNLPMTTLEESHELSTHLKVENSDFSTSIRHIYEKGPQVCQIFEKQLGPFIISKPTQNPVRILIFMPPRYHLLISALVNNEYTVLTIKVDWWRALAHIDKYFEGLFREAKTH